MSCSSAGSKCLMVAWSHCRHGQAMHQTCLTDLFRGTRSLTAVGAAWWEATKPSFSPAIYSRTHIVACLLQTTSRARRSSPSLGWIRCLTLAWCVSTTCSRRIRSTIKFRTIFTSLDHGGRHGGSVLLGPENVTAAADHAQALSHVPILPASSLVMPTTLQRVGSRRSRERHCFRRARISCASNASCEGVADVRRYWG